MFKSVDDMTDADLANELMRPDGMLPVSADIRKRTRQLYRIERIRKDTALLAWIGPLPMPIKLEEAEMSFKEGLWD